MTDPTAKPNPPAGAGQPIALTLNPRLDATVVQGWEAWDTSARAAGPGAVAAWIAQRMFRKDLRNELEPFVAAYLDSSEPEDRAAAIAELAEIVEGGDDLIADTLWEALLALGKQEADPDMIIEAIGHLAAIAEDHGEPLSAAEYQIEFLNWRRQDEHTSDPESIADAFDEIIRLAEQDGDPEAVAIYEFRLATFMRLADSEDERASTGDWERNPAPYESWS